jgi:muramidase (phage lysozyme)
MARISVEQVGPEMCAFLDMIALSEIGRSMLDATDDGYNVLVGSKPTHLSLFNSYEKHPARFVYLPKYGVKSSAAGRYQFLLKTWNSLQVQLKLPDFGPLSQDIGAIELIRGRGAKTYVEQGRPELAIVICSQEWASLPGAGYGQPENKLTDLLNAYDEALKKYLRPDFSNVISGVNTTGG